MTTEVVHASLLEALRWIGAATSTGSLRVGGANPASLFFDHGRLYFATVDGYPMSGSELADASIDRGLWQQASTRPGAKLHFVDELVAVGCHRSSIERFIRNRLETAIATIGLHTGPVEVGKGRHGFGAAVSFRPDEVVDLGSRGRLAPIANEDSLVSLATVSPTSTITIDGASWNSLTRIFAPARYAELSLRLGLDATADLTADLSARGLLNVVESHQPLDPFTQSSAPHNDQPASRPPVKASLFDDAPAFGFDDDNDEYVPDKVGRQAYAAMASMRASAAEPPPQEKARALRRLIEAVKGL